MNGNFWIKIDGRGYFVRFQSHNPPNWFTNRRKQHAYCFASVEEAQRVVNQLKQYGWQATVVTERPPPPPLVRPSPNVLQPPDRLRPWIQQLINAARASGLSQNEAVKSGYRTLALQYHPDTGGTTSQMQSLNEALDWLQTNELIARIDTITLIVDDCPF